MKLNKILVVGINKTQLDNATWERIKSLTNNLTIITPDDPNLDNELKDTDALLVYFNKADRSMIDKAPNLKYIGALATGVGKIDTEYAKKKNIIVTNIPGYATESVAEFVFAALLENLRQISKAKIESRKKRTSEVDFKGEEIMNKKFGIIGLGNIGNRVATIARSFGAEVSYWSRNKKVLPEHKEIIYKNLANLLGESEIISLHLALNSETENILNKDLIEKIKNGAIFINTAPLELLDINAIKKRLKNKDITFIFDHTDPGDVSDEVLDELRSFENCISYPVLGYWTEEAKTRKQDIFVNNIRSFTEGNPQNKFN
ncbi:MAG TPA: NAD(P)-dependent oxidoreductase [Patescibacteria group bacterium]|nr:NAD(P)-dependent oxidoreductase [Patescibacteria group bacterium]